MPVALLPPPSTLDRPKAHLRLSLPQAITMAGSCRRSVLATVAGALLSVALVAGSTGAAATSTSLDLFDTAIKESLGAGAVRDAGELVPCDYTLTDTVLVEAPCKGKCGVDRPYRVNRVLKIWATGTPRSKDPICILPYNALCTPTRAFSGGAAADEAKRPAFQCVTMLFPCFKELCPHAPKTLGCGWETTAHLSRAAAAALKAALPKMPKRSITVCTKPEVATI